MTPARPKPLLHCVFIKDIWIKLTSTAQWGIPFLAIHSDGRASFMSYVGEPGEMIKVMGD